MLRIESELCEAGPSPRRLTNVGVILAPSPATTSTLPEFVATFDICPEVEEGAIFEVSLEPTPDTYDVVVVAGLEEAGVRRSAEGCREDLVIGAWGRSPCVFAQGLAYVESSSVTRLTIDLDESCGRQGACGVETCELLCR